jgi:ribosomal protein L40E
VVSRQNASWAIGLIIFGALLTAGGAATWNACASAPAVAGVAPDCGGFEAITIIGVVLLLLGIGVVLAVAFGRPRTIYPTTDPAVPPPLIQPVLVQQTIVQQSVEVRCRYCGGLNPVTATKCASCGAAL